MTLPDLGRLRDEAAELLSGLVAIDTTNPPGNEYLLADYLRDWFRQRGIDSRSMGPRAERQNLIARLEGTGKKKPVMLLAHSDVVGVERDRWSSDPFKPVERDGYLYGRGVLDDKGMMAVEAVALAHLKRLDSPLDRDVIFLAAADEEAGGGCGVRWLMENHPDLIQAEYALNEGGEATVGENRRVRILVQAAEKVAYNVTLTARGTPGHASVPLPDNPVALLSRAVAAISRKREKIRLNPVTRDYFRAVAADRGWWAASLGRMLAWPVLGNLAARAFADNPVHDSMLRNSTSPTIIKGGMRANVIPAEAKATLNCRLLPGESLEAFIQGLRRTVSDDRVEISWEETTGPSLASPVDGPFIQAIARVAPAVWPGAEVAPYMSTGATDSAVLRNAGIQTYGLVPLPHESREWDLMHGDDERLRLETLGEGVKFTCELVRAIASI